MTLLPDRPMYAQGTDSDEISLILAGIDTLKSDSDKVTRLLGFAGKKYRYHKDSRQLLDKAGEIAERSGNEKSLINYWYSMGNFFYFGSNPDSSNYYLEKALSVESVHNWPFLYSQILATQSGLQAINGQVSLALQTKLDAKEILVNLDTLKLSESDKIRRRGQISILDNSIGALYHSLKDFEQAIRYYTESYELLMELNDHSSAAVVIGNIGEMYMKQENLDQALEYLNASLELKENVGVPIRSIASTLFNIGRVHMRMGKWDTAMEEFNQALDVFEQERHQEGLIEAYIERGLLFLKLNQPDKARQDCEIGLNLAKDRAHVANKSKACECLYLVHRQNGDAHTALEYYEEHIQLRDSLFNSENIKQLAQLEMNYEFDREREIQRLESEVKLREHQRVTWLLIGGILFSLIISGLLFNMFRLHKRSNRILSEKNEQVSKALGEKEILLKEIHHRVKNNLQVISSLLSLQSRQLESPQARDAIQSGRNRVRSMALIHQKLYQDEDLVGVDLEEYIDNLTDSLVKSYQSSTVNVEVNTDIDPIKMDVDTIIPIGLILNELISNSFKYAFDADKGGTLEIVLKKQPGAIHLKVSDNGRGLPDHFAIESTKSLGYRLIKAFTDKLRATLTVGHSPAGTVVSISIPDPKNVI